MLCPWKLHMFFWEGLGNLIEKFFMMALPIDPTENSNVEESLCSTL